MDFAINRRVRRAVGNRHVEMSPQGVYPCRGEDRWIAISIYSDAHWRSLRTLMGDPAWARDARFEDERSRSEHADALDEYLRAWTRSRDSIELMNLLQRNGVPAAAVHDAAEHAEDPHWIERGVYQPTELDGYGVYPLPTSPWFFDGVRLGVRRAPPKLGEHDDQVFADLLGLTAEEIEALRRDDYIGSEPLSHEL